MSTTTARAARLAWRIAPETDLRGKLLGNQYVVYNCGSGDTHVLDPIAALLIEQLQERCFESEELADRVGALLNLEATEGLYSKLKETLSQLDRLGLIEPVIS
jgi:PqqD family protein of HPr-rel-A system